MSCPLCGLPPDLCTCKQKARDKWIEDRSRKTEKAEPQWLSNLKNPYIAEAYCHVCGKVFNSRKAFITHLRKEGHLVTQATRVARHTATCENITKYGICQVTGLECSIISKDCIFRKQRKPKKKRKTKKKTPLTKDPRINAFLDTLD